MRLLALCLLLSLPARALEPDCAGTIQNLSAMANNATAAQQLTIDALARETQAQRLRIAELKAERSRVVLWVGLALAAGLGGGYLLGR